MREDLDSKSLNRTGMKRYYVEQAKLVHHLPKCKMLWDSRKSEAGTGAQV